MKLDFITIMTNKLEESVKFYQDVLGFQVERRFSPSPERTIVFLNDGHGGQIEFISTKDKLEYGNAVSLGFYVEDILEAEKLCRKHNVEIIYGPEAMKSGVKLLHAKDANGVELGFVQQ